MSTEIVRREAPAWVWTVIDKCLAKSRDAEVKKAREIFSAAANAAKQEWAVNCWRFGLTPAQFGATFLFRNKSYTIIGIKARSPRFPILACNAQGKAYKFPADVIK